MVTHHVSTKSSTFSGFDRFSKFVLIGNNIDGYVNVDVEEFLDFHAATKRLPEIFKTLDFAGEWNVSFYQVPNNWKIALKYGYYKVPKMGKKVFSFGYMHCGDENEIFLTPALIHIACITKNIDEQWEDEGDRLEVTICEEYYTTRLIEHLDDKVFKDDNYPGDLTELYARAYV